MCEIFQKGEVLFTKCRLQSLAASFDPSPSWPLIAYPPSPLPVGHVIQRKGVPIDRRVMLPGFELCVCTLDLVVRPAHLPPHQPNFASGHD